MGKDIVCFDFDGTLIDEDGRIHPRDAELLAEGDRAVFVPATGRPLHSVRAAFERNGLFIGRSIPFPMVLQNGAALYAPNETWLSFYPLDVETQQELLRIVRRYHEVTSLLFSTERLEVLYPSNSGKRMIRRFDLRPSPFEERWAGRRLTKLTCVAASGGPLREMAQETRSLDIQAGFSLGNSYELTGAGVDKGPMLRELIAHLNLDGAPIAAAGDGENDLSMFRVATHSFVPTGSPASIRRFADHEIAVSKRGVIEPILETLGC